MRLVRGRAADSDADRDLTRRLLAETAKRGEPALRAWTPHRQVAFGRRDAREDGYDRAVAAAEDRGFPAVERSVGGRAVVYTGRTLAFAWCRPTDDARTGLDDRYETGVDVVVDALDAVGVDARPGEPPRSFCPGDYSVRTPSGKVAGIAQRVTDGAALVAGCVVVADDEAVAAVLDPVYDALGVPFDPESVGGVAAGGPADPTVLARALETAVLDHESVGPAERRVVPATEAARAADGDGSAD
ncbi:MAG: biotin/lipoate A/B protein ligase family protein [Halolamina sp.]